LPGKSCGTLATGSRDASGLSSINPFFPCEFATTFAIIDAVDAPSSRSFGVGASSWGLSAGDSLNVEGSEVTLLGAVDDELGTSGGNSANDESGTTVAVSVGEGDDIIAQRGELW
jgi:hypothetical protein